MKLGRNSNHICRDTREAGAVWHKTTGSSVMRFFGLCALVRHGVASLGMPLRAVIAQGTTADCTQATDLIDGLDARHLLAARGYDSDAIIDQAEFQGLEPIIPPKKNRKVQREYDKDLHKARRLVGNAFLYLKQWRGIEICKKCSLFSGLYSNQALFL